MLSPDDARAVAAEVAHGNHDAFRHVVREYGPAVRGYLAARLYRLDEVDDLAQEVFLAAFQAFAEAGRVADLGAWLRGIARNKLLAHARAAARRASAHDRMRLEAVRAVADELEALAAGERADEVERLLTCIAGLPDRLRRVVQSGLDGVKGDALADELGTTVGAVYALHYRAVQLLRGCLDRGTVR